MKMFKMKKYLIITVAILIILAFFSIYLTSPTGFIISIFSKPPEIINASIEPIKVEPSDYMIITAEIKDEYGIEGVKADMAGIEIINLSLVEGNATHGVYQATWFVHSVEVGKTYNATIIARNVKGKESSFVLQFHDDPVFCCRRQITINNSQNSNTLTDYQILVTLDTATPISQGKMRSDCGDIRFTDSLAFDTALWPNNFSYWIESGCNSANTRIWVKVPSISANSNKTIYVYYGNPSITSISNGAMTFLAFDWRFDGPIGGRTSYGGHHTCALLSDGTAKCWGYNAYGQLGDGTTTDRTAPVSVSGLTNAVSIAAGGRHTCALLSDGTAKCWGYNAYGQLGDGTTTDKTTPVSVSGLTNAVSIAGGYYHTCALLSGGTAKCWGNNSYGQLGDGTTTEKHTPVNVSGLTNAVSIAGGYYHTCALLSGGTAKCWGNNSYGQLGDGTTTEKHTPVNVSGLTNAISIAAGGYHTCALLSDGTAKCWGRNSYGQLGDGTTTNRTTPVNVSGLTNAVSIAVGIYHTCALLSDGTAKCWGNNSYGQLGDETTTNRNTPVNVLNYNLGGRYDKTNGIPSTTQKPPYFFESYFVRKYASPEPTTSVGTEESWIRISGGGGNLLITGGSGTVKIK